MAEYYPLLARAVAGLKTSSPQARRAIYERARGALLAQLRAMNPPIPEPDIARESAALDAAIARLESEHEAAASEAEAARKAQEKAEHEKAEQAKIEQAKIEEAAQALRLAEAKAAQERAAREEAEAQERAAREKQERVTREKAEAQARAAREEAEAQARVAREKAEAEARAAQERAEAQARAAAEAQARAEAEAKAAELARAAEAKRREEERLAAEHAAREHAEQEARLAAEKRAREERERAAAEQAEARRREEIAQALAAEIKAAEVKAAQERAAQERAAEEKAAAEAKAAAAHLAEAIGAASSSPAPPAAGPAPGPQAQAGPGPAPASEPKKEQGEEPARPDATRPPPSLAVPVKPPASAPPRAEPPPPPPAPDIVLDEPARDPTSAPPIAIRAPEPAAIDRGDPFAAFAAERDLPQDFGVEAPDFEGDARNKPSRPAAPLPPPERPSHTRHILAGAALALAMGAIGYAAWVLRDKPQELPRPKTGAETPAAQPAESGGKITERLGVAPSAPVPTVQAPAQTIRPAGTPAATPSPASAPAASSAPAAPAAPAQLAPARAAFLIQSEGAEPHKTYSGVVNWRVENGAWRADISAPEVKLAASFVMAKSADGGPASHKIDLRFQFDDPAYQIGRIGAPEMRKEENPYGDRLAAVAVPVTPNVYLIGLRKDEADIAYNLELIRSRNWIDIPMEMSDKRIAKVTFEKGPAGEATFAEALKGW